MGDLWRPADGQLRLPAFPAPSKRLRPNLEEGLRTMTGGGYLPPEAGYNPRREGVRNGNVYGPPGVMSSDVPGLAPPPGMRPYMPGGGGLTNFGIPSMEDPSMMAQDSRMIGVESSMGQVGSLGPNNGRQDFVSRQETSVVQSAPGLLPPDASATLYVEGIPADCKRREAAHIFRPFIGFKEVRLVQKEAKRPGGDPLVLCFVDFADARCAATALEALQGYKLDETIRDSSSLRLQFARVPGPRGPHRDAFGARHDNIFRKG